MAQMMSAQQPQQPVSFLFTFVLLYLWLIHIVHELLVIQTFGETWTIDCLLFPLP